LSLGVDINAENRHQKCKDIIRLIGQTREEFAQQGKERYKNSGQIATTIREIDLILNAFEA